MKQFVDEMLALINRERVHLSLQPLKLNQRLSETALKHSIHQGNNNTIYHNHADTGGFSDRILRDWPDCLYKHMAENVGFVKPVDVVEMHKGFMYSESHRKNILTPDFEEIGLGFYINTQGVLFCTQLFIQFQFEHYVDEFLSLINQERKRRLLPLLQNEKHVKQWSYGWKESRKKVLRSSIDVYDFPRAYLSIADIHLNDLLRREYLYLDVREGQGTTSRRILVDID